MNEGSIYTPDNMLVEGGGGAAGEKIKRHTQHPKVETFLGNKRTILQVKQVSE